ncbi:tetratricopeptide repeat protein [Burkholderia sp. Bp9012]|uniref:tetratricopeptide repeat protein n=1 Tax=Burkholderia sp. Bp9012 TaxID=2184562 RepID=UPI0016280FA0|nr:tetratricopeptide repeat protein [Burkholderia sp. Bp9012]
MKISQTAAAVLAPIAVFATTVNAAANPPATIGSIVENNGLARNGWLVVRTPTILQMNRSAALSTDERSSIDNYDALLKLKTDRATRYDVMNRIAALHVQLAARRLDLAHDEIGKAAEVYRALLVSLPGDPENDTTLYRLAHMYQLLGDDDACAAALTTLVTTYPRSSLIADSAFRAAQIRYSQSRYADAAKLYPVALVEGGKTYVLPAEYMLAWSDYQLGKYRDALPLALSILDKALPPGDVADPLTALNGVESSHTEMASDALRLADLSFIALGGSDPVGTYFDAARYRPRFDALLYASVSQRLLDRQRYGDAAAIDAAFVASHPDHPLAPRFGKQQIAALARGGFTHQAADAKARFVMLFEPGATYWKGNPPSPEVLADVHDQLVELAHYRHASVQAIPADRRAERDAAFAVAAAMYEKLLADFPDDPNKHTIELSLADALLDGGKPEDAAVRYHRVAYDYPVDDIASGAALAEVQTDRVLADRATGDAHRDALLKSVAASVALALRFPRHPQRDAVLVRAAQDLHGLGEDTRAIELAMPLTDPRTGSLDASLRAQAWAVVADAQFARHDYLAAQSAYASLLSGAPAEGRPAIVEQLALSVYRQGETARAGGDLKAAAARFEQVGIVAPGAGIVAQANYDAAHAYAALKDWPSVVRVLGSFRERYASSRLTADTDKLLADAYFNDHQYRAAIGPYARIAARRSEAADVRAEAGWFVARSQDKAGDRIATVAAYTAYLAQNDSNLTRSIDARERLAALSADANDASGQRRWLESIIQADASAGPRADRHTHFEAAKATLELARLDAARASRIVLRLPLDAVLPRRKAALEAALKHFDACVAYGFEDTTTTATLEAGAAYLAFAVAIEQIAPPRRLSAIALDAWRSTLGKEAQPFYTKARAAFEANLSRARDGSWDDSIRASARQLAAMDPDTYGKNDERDANDTDWR